MDLSRPAPAQPQAPKKIAIPGRVWPRIFKWTKYTIFAALIVDLLVYFFAETLNEAMDSFGWLLLLGVFQYESSTLRQNYVGAWEKWLLIAVQTIGYGIAIQSTVTYGMDHEWLDLANATLWLLVCASLAYDIYVPGDFDGLEWRIRNCVKIVLYVGLVACAATWGAAQEWLDCLDACLWLLCFGLVELNVFEFEEGEEIGVVAS
ncbi:hypothetical protein ACELLULO517_19085 [Acidisoma cellulosilytica]|uniref:Uncharacterized protein n=1 Tax=Acidisoma cellulosilyticum TaxID=2802395 RepID=A0A964E560_9PROT|nr:hypothetical protein [Acidisoma cellulosilyticum]MCB8882360.1 hypothetical protein [Acidisoma cellulosilyticum]